MPNQKFPINSEVYFVPSAGVCKTARVLKHVYSEEYQLLLHNGTEIIAHENQVFDSLEDYKSKTKFIAGEAVIYVDENGNQVSATIVGRVNTSPCAENSGQWQVVLARPPYEIIVRESQLHHSVEEARLPALKSEMEKLKAREAALEQEIKELSEIDPEYALLRECHLSLKKSAAFLKHEYNPVKRQIYFYDNNDFNTERITIYQNPASKLTINIRQFYFAFTHLKIEGRVLLFYNGENRAAVLEIGDTDFKINEFLKGN